MASHLTSAPPIGDTWKERAACRPAVFRRPEIFYPPRARSRLHGEADKSRQAQRERQQKREAIVAEAKAVCATCPVIAECRTYAREVRETEGIWGGETPEERGVTELR